MAIKKRESAETWRQRVRRWRQSGLTGNEFAAREGISPRSLTWWAWKLDKTPEKAPARPEPTFVPVRVRMSGNPAAPPPEALEITLPGGTTLRVPPAFDSEALARVIAVLEGPR